ncbi:cytochrome P450 4g15-like [Uranotaenia lowii]|uniref:cytochrome P450 4g15-like n=1 Tax=Uranotaenia lowii TaxID=190385 RepID=UPI002478CD35|nr:cytochrome P450 4g15-like [Uranotaenia lowii]
MWLIWVCVVIAWAVLQYRKYVKKFDFAKDIPTVEGSYPLIGIGYKFLGKNDLQVFEIIRELFQSKEKLRKTWLGPLGLTLFTTDVDIVQQVHASPAWLDKPFFYEVLNIGYGLFTSQTERWKSQRKALNPSFNIKILEGFIPLFDKHAGNLVRRLEHIPEGATFNALPYMMQLNMAMILDTSLDYSGDELDEIDKLADYIARFFENGGQRFTNFFHYFDCIHRFSENYRESKAIRKYSDEQVKKLIQSTINHYQFPKANAEPEDKYNVPQIFVRALFSNKVRKFDEKEIYDNLITISGAATDTAASIMSSTCLSLGFYPEWQQKLVEEMRTVFPSEAIEFTLESLKQLELTEMFIYEVIRLYPVGPMVSRRSSESSVINGIRIPAGVTMVMHIFNLHRREDIWGPDALQFNPYRFAKEVPRAFFGFSAGSRSCIGYRYAMMSMKIVLVQLLRKYRITTQMRPEDIRFKLESMLRFADGHMIQLQKRSTEVEETV